MKRRFARRRTVSQLWTTLESRRLMNAAAIHENDLHLGELYPAIEADASVVDADSDTAAASVALTAIPALNSNRSATAKIYLDFNGDTTSSWGAYAPGTTPAYDSDSDPTSFSEAEITAIENIWARVSEKYSPFNINVTTVDPGSLIDKQSMKVVVGGSGAWVGGTSGGIGYIGGFYNSAPNTAFVFENNLGNGAAKYVAEAASHEAGHTFGLNHQAKYSGTTLVDSYNPGNSLVAPIMGNSYSSARGLWWYGTSSSSTTMQDDLSILSNTSNGFGYRADDVGSSIASATALTLSGTTATASGIVERMTDADYFSFNTSGGSVNFSASPASLGAMLDLKFELRNAAGSVLAAADGATLGETLGATLAAGTYYLNVASHGSYGDVGQYTLTGTFNGGTTNPTPTAPDAPGGLAAAATSTSQVNVTWNDVSTETGYAVERSLDGATGWAQVGTTSANVTTFSNTGLTAGTTYFYRVFATNASGVSPASGTASATTNTAPIVTTPAAPSGLTATTLSRSSIRLNWIDSANNESGFYVERSTNGGLTFSRIATLGANTTTYTNSGLKRSTTYVYRVRAYNAQGTSDYTNTASSRTLRSTVPASASSHSLAISLFSSKHIQQDDLLIA